MLLSAALTVCCSLVSNHTVMDVHRTDPVSPDIEERFLRQVKLPVLQQEVLPLFAYWLPNSQVQIMSLLN